MLKLLARNMAGPALIVAGLCSVGSATADADVLLEEDWEGIGTLPSADWSVGSDDGSHSPYISETDGNPAPGLAMGGGTHMQQGWAWHNHYEATYVDTWLSIKSDAWLSCSGSHYTDVIFGLFDPSGNPSADKIINFTFNKGAGEHNISMRIFSDDPDHSEQHLMAGAYTCEDWNTGEILIRPDGRVEFYLNDALLWTTTKTIDPAFDGVAKFYYRGWEGGGPAYADNLVISRPHIALAEGWDGVSILPNSDWSVGSDDGSHSPYISETDGNPAPGVAMGGGTHMQQGWAWHNHYEATYVDTALSIKSDAWLSCSGSHYTDVIFGLFDPSGNPSSDKIINFTFNKGAGEHNISMRIFSDDPDHSEQHLIPGAYTCEDWNTGEILIRPDGRVEFYLNDALLWTTTKTIDPGFDGVAKFYYRGWEGGGPAYGDNLTVLAPECGNGLVERGEYCDDGNEDDGDLCMSNCVRNTSIPAVSEWGIVATALLMLTAGTLMFMRRTPRRA